MQRTDKEETSVARLCDNWPMRRKKWQPKSIFIVNFCFVCWLEPKSGFHIAFNMFDTDGNARVDKQEFMVVSKEIHSSDKRILIWKDS